MSDDVQKVYESLQQLQRLIDNLAYDAQPGWDSYRRPQVDVVHLQRVVASLTQRVLIIDDMSRQVYGPPVFSVPAHGYQTGYRPRYDFGRPSGAGETVRPWTGFPNDSRWRGRASENW